MPSLPSSSQAAFSSTCAGTSLLSLCRVCPCMSRTPPPLPHSYSFSFTPRTEGDSCSLTSDLSAHLRLSHLQSQCPLFFKSCVSVCVCVRGVRACVVPPTPPGCPVCRCVLTSVAPSCWGGLRVVLFVLKVFPDSDPRGGSRSERQRERKRERECLCTHTHTHTLIIFVVSPRRSCFQLQSL